MATNVFTSMSNEVFLVVLSINLISCHCIPECGLTTWNDLPFRNMSCHQTKESCNAVINVVYDGFCHTANPESEIESLTIASVDTWSANHERFLNVTWISSNFSTKNQRDSLQQSLMLQLSISSQTSDRINCYVFTIDYHILTNLNGQFSVQCINISSFESPLTMNFTYFVPVKRPPLHYKPVCSEELKIVFSDKNISQKFWANHLRYLIDDRALQVQYIPPPNPSVYSITFLEASSNGTCSIPNNRMLRRIHGKSSLPSTDVRLSVANLNPCHFYCAQVIVSETNIQSINCDSGCASKVSDTIFFQAAPAECRNWTARMAIDISTSLQEISVYFEPCCKTEHCFRAFDMALIKLLGDDCNGVGIVAETKYFKMEKSINTTLVFVDIVPGNYCVSVQPIHPFCSFLSCIPRFSETVNFIEKVKLLEVKSEHRPLRPYMTLTFLAFIITLVVLVGLAVFFFFRKKIRLFHLVTKAFQDKENRRKGNDSQSRVMDTRVNFESDEESSEREVLKHSSSCTTYLFLHTLDTSTKNSVKHFISVLRAIADKLQFNVEFESVEEQKLEISKNRFSWIQSHVRTNENDLPGNSKRKVIAVESKRAVLHQKILEARALGDNNLEELEDQLYSVTNPVEAIEDSDVPYDKVFEEALVHLTSLDSSAKIDYENLLVVHFLDSTPVDEKLLYVVPGERFYIPSCLFRLVKRIFNITNDDPYFMESLLRELHLAMSENEYFKNFLNK